MSYRFRTPDRLAFEVRRVAGERLEHALKQLDSKLDENPAKAVHEARKDLKKTRSLLRLVRDSLGEERYRAENDRLRDAAHTLAGAREADAKVESLAALIEHVGGDMGQVASNEARAWLTALRAQGGPRPEVHQAAAQAVILIRRSRDDSRLWALGYGSFEIVGSGLRRTYRQGRSLLEDAAQDPSDETTHEWRKRVKDMWYSLRLIGAAWPPVLKPMADQAHRLSELLGDHHDLGEVRLAIEAGDIGLLPAASDELLGHVQVRQAQLHGEAISLGRRLYAEKPGGYVTRLEGLWDAWAENCAQQVGQDGLPGS